MHLYLKTISASLFFGSLFLESMTPNHKIALNKYAQGMFYSNKQKEYLDNAGEIVAEAIKKTDSEKASKDQDPVLDPESFEEFDFISKKGEGLFYPEGVTLSHSGRAFLAYLATAQTTNMSTLEKRGKIIAYLQKNLEFKSELLKILRLLKQESEESCLEFSWPMTEKEREEQNNFFFNRSNLILPDFITKRLVPQRFVNWWASYFSNHPKSFNFLNMIQQPCSYSLLSSVFLCFLKVADSTFPISIPKRVFGVAGMYALMSALHEQAKSGNIGHWMAGISGLGMQCVVSTGVIYSCCKATKDYYKSFLAREQRLVGAQKTVQVGYLLDKLLAKHPEFSQHLLLKSALQATKNTQVSNSKIAVVLDQFNNNRIKSSSFLNYWLWGDRIIVNKLLTDDPSIMHNYILPTLAGLGEIDAYCALSGQLSDYAVPQFVDNGIQISLKQFFHPNMKNPVRNDLNISFENEGKALVCVSGGNGSGKSAITRSVIGAVKTALTFNRVSALSGTFSRFDKIVVFANLSDNLGVASKFQVELAKLKKLQQYLEKNPEKKVLLMIDEPLTSTNTDLVGKILFDLFGLFSKYHNLLVFCVSNTPSLKNIEGALHMGTVVDKNPDGTFKPTYIWKEGPAYMSDVWYQFRKVFGPEFGGGQQV